MSQLGDKTTEGNNPTDTEGEIPEGFNPSQFGGEMPEGFDPSQFGEEFSEGVGLPQTNNEQQETESLSQFGEIDEKWNTPNMNLGGNTTNNVMQNLTLYGVCFLVLIAGLTFAILFKRKAKRR